MVGVTDFITPVFLFSLPRSGSTLTQRMIATHPDVETSGEPWILLPLLYTRIRRGVYAEYSHRTVCTAIEEFCEGLPGGSADYLKEIRETALRLYRLRAGEGARYFLDKSPRYHVVASEIVELFPEGRFIFLWRNPLSIVSSLIETWGKGRWNVYEFEFDLFEGLARLVAARQRAGERACAVQYEAIVGQSSTALEAVFEHLSLGFDAERTRQFSVVEMKGQMRDPTGTEQYQRLSQEPLNRWKSTLASPMRKWWCKRYLRWIGRERLGVMGYDLGNLLDELDAVPSRYKQVPSDILRMIFGVLVRTFEPWILRDKLRRIMRGERLYALR